MIGPTLTLALDDLPTEPRDLVCDRCSHDDSDPAEHLAVRDEQDGAAVVRVWQCQRCGAERVLDSAAGVVPAATGGVA